MIGVSATPTALTAQALMPSTIGVTATPTPTLAQNQASYVARKWGMFIHFNLSTFNNIEWVLPSADINTFNPGSTLNIDQWVTTAQAGKVKYACLTAKHHDGFCLWPSSVTTRNVSQTTWYAANGSIDIVSQFTTKFRAAGITPLLYFSVWDRWFEANRTVTQAAYRTYLEGQITELLTNYGAIGGLWLDGMFWHSGSTSYPWDTTAELNSFIHNLQPACLEVNNSHSLNLIDSDIVVYENNVGLPPSNNTNPAEYVDTIRSDANWFWKPVSETTQTSASILANLATCNARNASMMINVPPDNTGNMVSADVTTMTAIGNSLP